MKKSYLFIVALFYCMMNVELKANETVLYESNGIHYVLVEMTFADNTSRSGYVVHPETTIENEDVPTVPSSYTGAIVIEETIRYEGNDFPVKFINDSAFHQSTITSIDLPATITTFSKGAFLNCQTLQTIICRATTPPATNIRTIPWQYENIFGSLDPDQVSVYVPEDALQAYQAAGGWDTFTHFYAIESMQGVETVQPSTIRVQKLVRNGQLFIIRDNKTFNALGAEVR